MDPITNSLHDSLMFEDSASLQEPPEISQDLTSNSDAGASLLHLLELMKQQHQEVMQAFFSQDAVLKQLRQPQLQTAMVNANAEPSSLPVARTPSALNLARSITLGTGTGSMGSAGSGMATLDPRGLNSPGVVPKSPGEQSLAPSLFTSYSQDDMLAKLDASKAQSPRISETNEDCETPIKRVTCLQRITRHVGFDIFFGVVVVTNAIFIGIDVQTNVGNESTERPVGILAVRYFYTVAFTTEILLRLAAEGRRFLGSEQRMWNLFDTVIVMAAWLEVGIDIARIFSNTSDLESIEGVSSLRAFRILRLTRILKTAQVIRVLRFVMALRTLVTSILSTLKALFWALLLLFLIIYIFALVFTQAMDDDLKDQGAAHLDDQSYKYFGSLFHSMLSLFMSIAGGVSWEDVIEPLMRISHVWTLAFLFYVAFTYFAVLNVVTASFCQSAIESAQQDHATVVQSMLENKEAHLEKMRAVFSEIASSGDGGITFPMLEEKIHSPTVRGYLETLGLDVWDPWSFFKLLDTDGGGSIEIEEFFMGCLRLGGDARAMDVGKVLQDQQWLMRNQGKFQAFVEGEIRGISELLSYLIESAGHKTMPSARDL